MTKKRQREKSKKIGKAKIQSDAKIIILKGKNSYFLEGLFSSLQASGTMDYSLYYYCTQFSEKKFILHSLIYLRSTGKQRNLTFHFLTVLPFFTKTDESGSKPFHVGLF